MIIFIDSGPIRALNNSGDNQFVRAKNVFAQLLDVSTKVVTSDYIIDEAYTGLLKDPGYHAAMNFDTMLRQGKWIVERITTERFYKAQEVFRKFNKDKVWSFTDCTSYVVMKELKIKDVFTFDKNFEEMGFKLL